MEIIAQLVRDLNRQLNIGLQVIISSDRILIFSIGLGLFLREYPYDATLDVYKDLTELQRMITSWFYSSSRGRSNTASTIRGQISVKFNFDIEKCYQLSKIR